MKRLSLVVLFALLPNIAFAESVLDTIGKRLQDPVGAVEATRELSQILDRARAHADALLDKADAKIGGHLTRIESEGARMRVALSEALVVADGAVDKLNQGLADRMRDLRELEREFLLSTASLVRCSAVKSTDELRRTFADIIGDIAKSRPRIVVDPPLSGPIIIGELEIDKTTVPEPVMGWEIMVRAYEAVLSDVSEDEPISSVTNIYDSIVLNSEDTLCFYRSDSASFARISLVIAEYARRSRVWKSLVY